jgi:hypothetical protein
VRHVKCDATGTYFICEHCGAEHEVRVASVPSDQPTRFEILRLGAEARWRPTAGIARDATDVPRLARGKVGATQSRNDGA